MTNVPHAAPPGNPVQPAVAAEVFGRPAIPPAPHDAGLVGPCPPTDVEPGVLPDVFYGALPAPLAGLAETFADRHERDVFTLAAVVASAGAMPRVSGVYESRRYAPHSYILVVAPPASGKGVGDLASRLLGPITARLSNGPGRQPTVMIPANSSASAFARQLEANGGSGVVLETEIDVLVETRRQDWGDYSSLLRQAAEHESVSLNRVDGLVAIAEPRLAVFMAGTPSQAARLFPSAEDGLFSRFGVYTFEPIRGWRSRRPTVAHREREQKIGEAAGLLDTLHRALSEREKDLDVRMTEDQWSTHDRTFEGLLDRVGDTSDAARATVLRAGVLAFRIATVLGVLRAAQDGDLGNASKLKLRDPDVTGGLVAAEALVYHAVDLAEQMPSAAAPRGNQALRFLTALPDEEFDRGAVLEAGARIGVKSRRADSLRSDLETEGHIVKVRHGLYRKSST